MIKLNKPEDEFNSNVAASVFLSMMAGTTLGLMGLGVGLLTLDPVQAIGLGLIIGVPSSCFILCICIYVLLRRDR